MKQLAIMKFEVSRKDFSRHRIVEKRVDSVEAGEILLKINRFAFTSNNITYAVVGDQIGYWNFFPAETGWGIIPVWGFAEVVESGCPGIRTGDRYYGYYPMASHLIAQPAKISTAGFIDASIHRKELPSIYNYYRAYGKAESAKSEAIEALFRPLFTTSFLIDAFLDSNDFFGARQIVLTSASSKTAYGLAFLLSKRKEKGDSSISIKGLTSSRNLQFVRELGFYEEVISYEEVNRLPADEPAVIIDFSGNHELQYDLQTLLGNQLKYNCLVGLVHHEKMYGKKPLPQKGTFFFAPTQAVERSREWGAEGFERKLATSWNLFSQNVEGWIEVSEQKGLDAIVKVYSEMLKGAVHPERGEVLKF